MNAGAVGVGEPLDEVVAELVSSTVEPVAGVLTLLSDDTAWEEEIGGEELVAEAASVVVLVTTLAAAVLVVWTVVVVLSKAESVWTLLRIS